MRFWKLATEPHHDDEAPGETGTAEGIHCGAPVPRMERPLHEGRVACDAKKMAMMEWLMLALEADRGNDPIYLATLTVGPSSKHRTMSSR